MQEKVIETTHEEILKELKLIRKDLRKTSEIFNLKRKFISSMVGGFGTVLGATVLVSLLIFILTQLATIQILEPIVKAVITIVARQK
jgi:hypothetical protein